MEPRDVPQVSVLLDQQLKKYNFAPIFSPDEVAHWLLPKENVVYCYVVEVRLLYSNVLRDAFLQYKQMYGEMHPFSTKSNVLRYLQFKTYMPLE
jgi:hypothetical protein